MAGDNATFPLRPHAPIYPPKPKDSSPASPQYERAVLGMVDDTTNPTMATVYIGNEFPAQDGYKIPTNIGVNFAQAPNPFANPPAGVAYFDNVTTLDGGSWVMVDVVNRTIVSIEQGVSNAAPVDPSNLFKYIKHDGAYNTTGGFQNPNPIDTNQVLGNPSPTTPPSFNVAPGTMTFIGTRDSGGNLTSGSYDAVSTFTLNYGNPTWLGVVRLIAIASTAHTDPFTVTSTTGVLVKSDLAPNSTGQYTGIWHGLSAGTAYDLYVAYIDLKSVMTPLRYVGNTGTNPIVIGGPQQATGASAVTPVATANGTFSAGAIGAATTDFLNTTWTMNSVGTTATPWLAEIVLVASVASSGNWTVAGTVAPNAPGTYSGVWSVPSGGLQYDLGIKYRDFGGYLSNPLKLGTVTPNTIPSTTATRLPGGSSPTVTVPTFSYSDTSPNSYALTFNFTADTNAAKYAGSLTGITGYYAIHGTTNYLPLSTLPISATQAYAFVLFGLPDGSTTYDFYVQYIDATGNPGGASGPYTSSAHTAPVSGSGGTMPAGTVCNATGSGTVPATVSQNGAGYDYGIAFTVTGAAQIAPLWLQSVELVYAPTGTLTTNTTAWRAMGTVPANTSGSYTGYWSLDNSNNFWDVSVRLVDFGGNRSGIATKLYTTQNYKHLLSGGGATNAPAPVITTNSGITYANTGSGAYDALATLTPSAAGTDGATSWMYQWELLVSVPNANAWIHYAYIQSPASVTGVLCKWIGLGAGNRYDLGLRYTDNAGGVTPVYTVGTTVANPIFLVTAPNEYIVSSDAFPIILPTSGLTVTTPSFLAQFADGTKPVGVGGTSFNLPAAATTYVWLNPDGTWFLSSDPSVVIPTSILYASFTTNATDPAGGLWGTAVWGTATFGQAASVTGYIKRATVGLITNVGRSNLLSMPAYIMAAGPSGTAAAASSRAVHAGLTQTYTLTFTESDFTSPIPDWVKTIWIARRINGDTGPNAHHIDIALDPNTYTSPGSYSKKVFVNAGDTVDFGLYYEDMTGAKSAINWAAAWSALGDANGSFIDPVTGDTVHARMSGPYQTNFDSSGNLRTSAILNSNVPNSLALVGGALISCKSSGVSPTITQTFYLDDGDQAGGDIVVRKPDGTTLTPGHLGVYSTSTSPFLTLTGIATTDTIYFLVYWKNDSAGTTNGTANSTGWRITSQKNTAFRETQTAAAFADGGLFAFMASTGTTYSFAGGATGGGTKAGAGGRPLA